jgi:4-amino-4-deoxy-L-arabinose transferase-like glycosyltransferase
MPDGDNNVKQRPRRGPWWAYVLGGAFVLPFLVGFVLGLFRMRVADTGVQPTTLFIAGAAVGWMAYRIFSKPRPDPSRPSDLDV